MNELNENSFDIINKFGIIFNLIEVWILLNMFLKGWYMFQGFKEWI